MKLNTYSINIKGLKEGLSEKEFEVDKSFFERYEGSKIQDGNFNVGLEIDKKTRHVELNFDFKGSFKTECDRCLENIELPVEGHQDFILKFGSERSEEGNVIYVPKEIQDFDLSQLIYEIIHLAVPIRKVLPECEAGTSKCDSSLLELIEEETEEQVEDEKESSSPWDELKNFKSN